MRTYKKTPVKIYYRCFVKYISLIICIDYLGLARCTISFRKKLSYDKCTIQTYLFLGDCINKELQFSSHF